ncbi:insulinase family protein [Verrucomicrobiota bacterium]
MKQNFELISEQEVKEINSAAKLYRHKATGAEFLSVENDDENKVFGIAFRTPPKDGTGVAHILEHTVLCGSRKYPVKDPFVQLLKGSLQTFLNAFTYPDKTCYPVASCNLQDFYNLVDVYLDAVFYPLITPDFFKQEGWHYELDSTDGELSYKGVVYNEMKGVYSSPDALLGELSCQSLYPDTVYGQEYGGDPEQIPNLTYEQFKNFHDTYYHPSNARIIFYGNDDPEKRFEILEEYLKDYQQIEVGSDIPLQSSFYEPRRIEDVYASSGDDAKPMFTVNWRLPETTKTDTRFALDILDHILIGAAASPLRKALIESGLGEDLTGGGLETHLQQMSFSIGLKGVAEENLPKAEKLIYDTLSDLSENGIDPNDTEAALNTLEFMLRENNTSGYPRGLSMWVKSLTTWLYDEDPMSMIAFEKPLQTLKDKIAADPDFFETMIAEYFLGNTQRTTVIIRPDNEKADQMEAEEKARLENVRSGLTDEERNQIVAETEALQELQETPDAPEDLAKIPMLHRADMEPKAKIVPRAESAQAGANVLYHDLFTNGILYLDIGFDLHVLPQKYLKWLGLYSSALTEMGTQVHDFVTLSQLISQQTGGIRTSMSHGALDSENGASRCFLRSKCMVPQSNQLLNLIEEILFQPNFDNKERFRQIVLEQKATLESCLIPSGHSAVAGHLKQYFNEAFYASEQACGFDTIFFLRELVKEIDADWNGVRSTLEEIHQLLINRNGLLVNITLDQSEYAKVEPALKAFIGKLPAADTAKAEWTLPSLPQSTAFTAPSQVNYAGCAINLFDASYERNGSTRAITSYLRTAWLWEQVRVQGGAYGAMCGFDAHSGAFHFVSYRDPNIARTLETYKKTAQYLQELDLHEDELSKAIVGAIGGLDKYQLPDAKGYSDTLRCMLGVTNEERQQRRDELLATTADDFRAFGAVLEKALENPITAVLGSAAAIEASGVPFEKTIQVL